MKTKLKLVMLALFTIVYSQKNVYSQRNISLPNEAVLEENTLQNTFSNLDKSKIETGLLLDTAVEFANLKHYE